MKQVDRNPMKRHEGLTIGRARFAKISAIEGVHLTAEMDQVLDEFEREELSPAERRRVIAAKYGTTRQSPP
jgi:hypothetical protein